MKCCGKVLLNSKFFCKRTAEVGCKSGVSVADNSFGESKPSVKMIEIEFGDLGSGDCGHARKEYCASRTSMVNYCEDHVVPFAVG